MCDGCGGDGANEIRRRRRPRRFDSKRAKDAAAKRQIPAVPPAVKAKESVADARRLRASKGCRGGPRQARLEDALTQALRSLRRQRGQAEVRGSRRLDGATPVLPYLVRSPLTPRARCRGPGVEWRVVVPEGVKLDFARRCASHADPSCVVTVHDAPSDQAEIDCDRPPECQSSRANHHGGVLDF
jgi:hypothetical protein